MGTGNEPQSNHPGQQTQTPSGQKSGKAPGRFVEELGQKTQAGKGNPTASNSGHDPQRITEKISDGGQADLGPKGSQPSGH